MLKMARRIMETDRIVCCSLVRKWQRSTLGGAWQMARTLLTADRNSSAVRLVNVSYGEWRGGVDQPTLNQPFKSPEPQHTSVITHTHTHTRTHTKIHTYIHTYTYLYIHNHESYAHVTHLKCLSCFLSANSKKYTTAHAHVDSHAFINCYLLFYTFLFMFEHRFCR